MCGICGILRFDGQPSSAEVLAEMTNSLYHRGPDDGGLYAEGPAGLGHRRLAVIDPSPAGHQPMANEDRSVWITFNGEIYNFAEIRTELQKRGHIFRSATDTEVILHAYETWGVDCLARFNGMFAFALWDAVRQRLWLVRDRLGIKPLFYMHRKDCLLFASEIKAILCDPSVERRVDVGVLHHFLSLNYTPAPYSLFCGIRQLLPGHYLLVEVNGRCQELMYWEPSYARKKSGSEADLVEQFETELASAVKRCLVSDVPVGAFLSGGVDSSAIVYWMSSQSQQRVQTFSIGFHEESYSELNYARQVAKACQSQHHERVVTPDAVKILPKIVWHAEEPTADSSMLPLYSLAEMTREKVTVALTGDGADEILAGYETYPAYYAMQLYRCIPAFIRRRIIAPFIDRWPTSYAKVSLDFKLKRFVRGAELDNDAAHAYWRTIFDEAAKQRLYTPEVLRALNGADTVDLYRTLFAQTDATHPLDRMLYVDTRFYLPNDMLVKVDRMTMAHSLEARVPFLDHRLVEFAASLPPGLKLKQWRVKKYLLKAALRRRLPSVPLWRKKQGFNVPVGAWLNGELGDFVLDQLAAPLLQRMGLFNPREVTNLINEHLRRKRDNSHQIWGLLYLSLWWQQFIRQPPKSSPSIRGTPDVRISGNASQTKAR
jgi:asparagine synthase (glutamine-hydrolysing)